MTGVSPRILFAELISTTSCPSGESSVKSTVTFPAFAVAAIVLYISAPDVAAASLTVSAADGAEEDDVWQQDHNGFTHQDPGFLDHVVNKKADIVRVYLPPDANCLLSVADHCLRSRNYVNVIVAGKHALPQWLTMDQAVVHCSEGIGIWQWASNDRDAEPDVVMACCGDTPTLETMAATSILRRELPDLKIRVVNVVDLMKLQPDSEHPHGLSDADYDSIFTTDKHIIFNFHGYPWLIHRLTYRRSNRNLHVRGYTEEGTITTPFDLQPLQSRARPEVAASPAPGGWHDQQRRRGAPRKRFTGASQQQPRNDPPPA
jgi:phosphoketolase